MRLTLSCSIVPACLMLACGSSSPGAVSPSGGSGSSSSGSGDGSSGETAVTAGAGSGGSATSAAGSPGAAGATQRPPQVHVGDCSNLPEKGKWENISPPNSNYAATYTGINAIVLRSDDPSVIFVGADSAGIFRSSDCGSTWSEKGVNTGTNGDAINTGRTWSLAMDPIVPDVMYAVQGYGKGGLWKTSDAGVDWKQVLPDNVLQAFNAMGAITSVAMDPSDHTHLLIESHGSGSGPCATGTCLAESEDSGDNWKIVVFPQGWSENSCVVLLSRKNWLMTGLFGGLWGTTDQGATWKKLSGAYATANYYQPYVWQDPQGVYYVPTHQQGLLKSAPNDPTVWTEMPNTASGTVMFPSANNLFMADEFMLNYYTAPKSDPTKWSKFPTPDQGGTNSQGGAGVYMNYDPAHHILYSANFNAGLWRVVVD